MLSKDASAGDDHQPQAGLKETRRKKTPWRPRVSLRTLLILITLGSIVFAYAKTWYSHELGIHQAVQELTAAKWKIECDQEEPWFEFKSYLLGETYQGRPKSARDPNLFLRGTPPSRIDEHRFELVSKLTTLESLSINQVKVGDFPALKKFKNLKSLALLSDSDNISWLKGCDSLTHLDISTPSEVIDLSLLRPMHELKNLRVSAPKLNDLRPLSGLQNLERLEVGCSSGNPEFRKLLPPANLPKLTVLVAEHLPLEDGSGLTTCPNLKIVQVPVKSLSWTKGLNKLEKIRLSSWLITDLSPLAGKTDLVIYGLFDYSMQIKDLSPLDGFKHLEGYSGKLKLDYSQLETLPNISNAEELKHLIVSGTKVTSLEPLRVNHLERLCLEDSPISDLSPLESSNLKDLKLKNLLCDDLSELKKLDQVTRLEIQGLPATDLTPLSNMVNLETLVITDHQIKDFSVLKNFSKLTSIKISDFPESQFDVLGNLPIRALMLPNSTIKTLGPLSAKKLRYLDLSNSQFEDFQQLKKFTSLRCLSLEGTKVADLSPLSALRKLRKLDLKNTSVVDLSPLRSCKLEAIDLRGTGVTDISPIVGAENICLANCSVTDLRPLQQAENVEYLDLSGLRVDPQHLAGLSISFLKLSHAELISDFPIDAFSLDLSHSNFEDLKGLSREHLGQLDLSYTKVKDIRPLLGFDHIYALGVEGIDIPAELKDELVRREFIDGIPNPFISKDAWIPQ